MSGTNSSRNERAERLLRAAKRPKSVALRTLHAVLSFWNNLVPFIHQDNFAHVVESSFPFQPAKTSDNNQIANERETRSSTVDADFSRATGGRQGIGFEAPSVIDIPYMNCF